MKTVLALENFQSHEKSKLEIDEGLTLITGPNSSGKSSLIRALSALISNPSGGKSFIKYGEDFALVELTLEGKETVYWQRKKDTVLYKIGDGTFIKMGRGNVFDVMTDFPMIRDDSDEIVNIQDEWSVTFPFGYSNTDLFALFENVIGSLSNSILPEMKKDETEIKRMVDTNKISLDSLLSKLSQVESGYSSIDRSMLDRYLVEVEKMQSDLWYMKEDYCKMEQLYSLSRYRFDEPIDESPLKIYLELVTDNEKLSLLSRMLEQHFDTDVDVSSLSDIEILEKDYNQIVLLEQIFAVDIHEMEILIDVSILEDKDFLDGVIFSMGQLQKSIETLDAQLKDVETEIGKIDVCPLCGNQLRGDDHDHS
jgi:energy-coupling factor transporter ATP-binding protein EcfA2